MGNVAYGWDVVQDDRDILQATEQELQQRRARLQALEPDAETPTLVVSLPAVPESAGSCLTHMCC